MFNDNALNGETFRNMVTVNNDSFEIRILSWRFNVAGLKFLLLGGPYIFSSKMWLGFSLAPITLIRNESFQGTQG